MGENPDGSYTRPCYSLAYFEAVNMVESFMKVLGMETQRDAAGNIHGVLKGKKGGSGSIIIGSHLDTVPCGGLFDGAYGVAAGLEIVRRLRAERIHLSHDLELYGFNAEESNPLGGTFGSRAIAGLVDPQQPGLEEALKAYGHTIPEILACKRDFSTEQCYIELHIEQGDVLFHNQIDIGVVSGIVGIVRYQVTAIGCSNHAGTTMMGKRRDALVSMSKLIVAADQCCRELDERLVFTVGTMQVSPGSENVIPGKVTCTFEIRHLDGQKIDQFFQRIQKIAESIDTAEFLFEKKIDKGAVLCDKRLMEVIEQSAAACGKSHVVMPSGAGHDANPMAHCLPVGMIFVPSKDGVSHCKEEWTDAGDLENGVEVLYQTVLALDRNMNFQAPHSGNPVPEPRPITAPEA